MINFHPPRSTHHWLFTLLILLVLATLAFSAPATTSQYRQSLVQWEGYRTTVYSRGIREPYLVGIGHRLTDAERRAHPSPHYTATQINQLFYSDLARAKAACQRTFLTFNRQPAPIQILLVNLAFTCGPTGLTRWRALRFAIDNFAYEAAAAELVDSRWWVQVQPARANAMLRVLKNAY